VDERLLLRLLFGLVGVIVVGCGLSFISFSPRPKVVAELVGTWVCVKSDPPKRIEFRSDGWGMRSEGGTLKWGVHGGMLYVVDQFGEEGEGNWNLTMTYHVNGDHLVLSKPIGDCMAFRRKYPVIGVKENGN
jgi:hypothetical protein